MKTLEGQLDETLLTDRLIAALAAGFGLLATLLASVGLYGVMAFVVARRRKELGIRLALGAEPGGVIWLVMKEVLLLLAIGLAVGIPTALGLGRFVASQLYGIEARDPWTATATLLLLTLVSAAAGLIPRIAPAGSIRSGVGTSSLGVPEVLRCSKCSVLEPLTAPGTLRTREPRAPYRLRAPSQLRTTVTAVAGVSPTAVVTRN
jgi:ABC-type antimicrobial peptide transport system permease subunit